MGSHDALRPRIKDAGTLLVADLEKLSPAQWQAGSLCGRWTTQDVVAHLVARGELSPGRFLPTLAKAKFNVDAAMDLDKAPYASGAPERTLALFTDLISTGQTPAGPLEAWLGEIVIHAEDIRRPLRIKGTYRSDDLMTLVEFYKGTQVGLGVKSRIKGVRLVAEDHPWSHGRGPEVRGTLLTLFMTMVGRPDYLGDLSGDGLPILRQRLTPTA